MIGIGPNLSRRPTANVWSSGADLDFMFAEDASVVPRAGRAQLLCTRAGDAATVFNRYGVLETVPANTPRINHDPSVLRFENILQWSEGFEQPTPWPRYNLSTTPNAGLAPDGKNTAARIAETSASSTHGIYQAVPALTPNTDYVLSFYAKAGERTKIYAEIQTLVPTWVGCTFDLAAGTASNAAGTITALPGGWYRCTVKANAGTGSSANNVNLVIAQASGTLNYPGDGTSGLYIWGAQLNSGPTALPYRRTGATPQPKEYACKGLLVEETRTNSLRNNTMVGGGAGAFPTNWSGTLSTSGITMSVVGVGVEDGISYLDLSYSGTASAAVTFYLNTESLTNIAAGSGQTWTGSAFLRVAAGARPSGSMQLVTSGRVSGGSPSSDATITLVAPTSAGLRGQRFTSTRTMADATTAYVSQYLAIPFANGEVVNITLRVGMPQIEQGAFATSVIPTSGAAVTRNADSVTVALNTWFNASAGSMLAEFECQDAPSGKYPRVWSLHDGTLDNAIHVVLGGTADSLIGEVRKDGGFSMQSSFSNYAGARAKAVLTWAANDAAFAKDGTANPTDTTVNVPTVTALRLGGGVYGTDNLNGHIRGIAYWRTRLPNADLQQLSA